MNRTNNIAEVVSLMPERLKSKIEKICLQNPSITEIRLRQNKPLILVLPGKSLFLSNSGELKLSPSECLIVNEREIESVFLKLCHYSVYTYKENLNSSFITTSSGNRVGIASEAVVKEGKVCSVKNISSLNFRIAGEHDGEARKILKEIGKYPYQSVLITGPPNCGKTTVLRAICKELSSGFNGEYKKCAVIDERGEIAARNSNGFGFDVGINSDVLSFFPKREGILNAVRTLSPEFVFFDEIGSFEESKGVIEGLNSGIVFFFSVHSLNIENSLKKPQIDLLYKSGCIDVIVLLNNGVNIGKIKEIRRV